ncbi:MAG TPA: 23S rRNA methyltransferase [Micromonosporaceae bacterium]
MLADIVRHLRCPVCASALVPTATGLDCGRGHRFDRARQGYVHLAAGPLRHPGDTADMIAARADFLAAGHYAFIAEALASTAADLVTATTAERGGGDPDNGDPDNGDPLGGGYPDLVVDVGAGTGYHLATVLDALPEAVGLALDASKAAARRAARVHPRAGAAVCDTWRRLPLADRSARLVLDVFAPRNGEEFRRVLRDDGALLVVTPTAEHLVELVDALHLVRVDPAKPERVAASLGGHLVPVGDRVLTERLRLSGTEVATLVGMGPSAWHLDPDVLASRVARLTEPVEVTASVRLSVWRKR